MFSLFTDTPLANVADKAKSLTQTPVEFIGVFGANADVAVPAVLLLPSLNDRDELMLTLV